MRTCVESSRFREISTYYNLGKQCSFVNNISAFCVQNKSTLMVFVTLLLIVPTLTESVDINSNVQKHRDFSQASLYKCNGESVKEEFLFLPESLQIPYPDEKLEYFAQKFNGSALFNFSLVERQLECSNEVYTLEIPKLLVFTDQWSPISPIFNFTPDGFLGYYKDEDEIYIHPENFCINKITQSLLQVQVCKSQCYHEDGEKGSKTCIPKCCIFGQVISSEGCVDAMEEDWMPNLYSDRKSINPNTNSFPQFQLRGYRDHWNCSGEFRLRQLLIPHHEFKILENGQIWTRKHGKKYWLKTLPGLASKSQSFCVDGFWKKNATTTNEYNPENSDQIIRMCVRNVTETEEEKSHKLRTEKIQNIYPKLIFVITLVASLIHTATIWVYATVTEQNVYGWTVLTFTFCQFLLNITLCIIFGIFAFGPAQASALIGGLHSLCIVIGILHHFLLVASFSWTTVITFDVWSKLRSLSPRRNSKGRKRFIAYCSFGFGVPTVIVLISVIMDFAISRDDSEEEESFVRPGYDQTCLIYFVWSYFYYITLPIIILFGSNMLFALHTLKFLWEAKKNIKVIKDSSMTSSFQNKSSLILKLFVLMGVFLSFEILLAFTSPIYISLLFIVLDCFRIFHALGIFWVFVWNKKVRLQLERRYGKKKNKSAESNMQFTVVDNSVAIPDKVPQT